MPHRVFLSYRRADSSEEATRLKELFERRLGRDSVFMDVSNIESGERWRDRLEDAVAGCDVMLVVIGPEWVGTDTRGRSRLTDPQDVVRREVAAGLASSGLVIPVLVRGATMPGPDGLPEELHDLAARHAASIAEDMWAYDAERLARTVTAGIADDAIAAVTREASTSTALVGRDELLERLGVLLETDRMVTLIGAGGCGKTSLALEAARGSATSGESVFVDLSAVRAGGDIHVAVAESLGIREMPAGEEPAVISLHLSGSQMLMVLDNCEHVVEGAARLAADLLFRCPALRILATSREPLGIEAEATLPVPPLAVPGEGDDPRDLEATASVQLFARRAHLVDPTFELSPATLAGVGAVCRRVDGIPLAIELAAAQMRTMDAATIAERLGSRIDLLGGRRGGDPRHRTMVDTLDWSYGLLGPDEARVFDRLSIFEGGFELEAAEAICGADLDAVRAVSSLLDRSLLVGLRGPAGFRYRMLEPVRQYASGHLEGSAQEEVADLYVRYFTELVEHAERGVRGPDQLRWHRRLRADFPNVRDARERASIRRDAETLGRLVGSLWLAWRGSLDEAFSWAQDALTLEDRMTVATRASLMWCTYFWTRYLSGSEERRAEYRRRAIGVLREAGDQIRLTLPLSSVLEDDGDVVAADLVLREGITLARVSGEDWWAGWLTVEVARAHGRSGDIVGAIGLIRNGFEIYRDVGDAHQCVSVSAQLGEALVEAGDLQGAASHVGAALELVDDELSPDDHAMLLCVLGDVARLEDDHPTAGRRYDEAFTLMWKSGFSGEYGAVEVVERLAALERARGRASSAIELWAVAHTLYPRGAPVERLAELLDAGEGVTSLSRAEAEAAWNRGLFVPPEQIPDVIRGIVSDMRP